MPNPIIPDRVYDPLANSQYTGSGQLVDRLTGMPISVAPAADPLIAQPQQQQPGMQAPAQQAPTIDVGAWEKEKDIYNKSSVTQRKLFDDYVNETYNQWQQANPNSPLTKDLLRQQLQQNLSTNDKNFITKGPEDGVLRDLAGTVAGGVTGLVDAAAGLINAGTSAVVGENSVTSALAKGARELNKAAGRINSEARQDFEKQRDEIMADEKKGIGDLVDLYMGNLGYGALDLAEIVGMGWGAGAAARVGLRAAERGAGAAAARTAASGAARELGAGAAGQAAAGRTAAEAARIAAPVTNAARLNRAANIIGQGGIGGGLGAQAIGERNGDFELTRQQAAGAGLDGLIAGLATGIGMRYGYTPESLLLGATPVRIARNEVPSLLRTTLRSMGVEASSNAVQSAADAILTTGYDKDGNFDMSKVDWNHVGQATEIGGLLGGLMGGGAGLVGGARDRSAARRAAAAEAADAEATGPTSEAQPADITSAEQRAMDDSRHVDIDQLNPDNNPQNAFMQNPAFRDYLDGLREAGQTDAAATAAMRDPLVGGEVAPYRAPVEGEVVDPLTTRPQAEQAPEQSGNAPQVGRAPGSYQDFVDTARQAYDSMPAEQRDFAVETMRQRVESYANDPETLAARQRELDRMREDYVETNPAQAQADQVRLTALDGLRQAYNEIQQHHQLRTNSALAYDDSAPTGEAAQSIIDERIAQAATPWSEVPRGTGAARRAAATSANAPALAVDGLQGVDPRTVVEARRMMSDYQQTPNQNKAAFVDRVNQANQQWFSRAYDLQDGRTFDQLAYDAQNATDPVARGRAQELYARASAEADRRVRLANLLNEEHRAWTEADNARREALQRDVNAVPDEQVRNIAAETVLQAQDGKAIRQAKIAGVSALKAERAATRVASELAKRGVPDAMRQRLDRDMLGEQRGSTQFMRTAAELTGAPTESMDAAVRFLRSENALAYGKEAVIRSLAGYEADPGASGRTRLHTTQYLNYLQDKQDAITQAIGEWRPISMEDVRRINAGMIPELSEVGNFKGQRDQIKNTRRYVNRIVNDKINSGEYEGDAAARLRLLRDWLIADQSEASYQTPVEARAANADIPNIRQLRTMNDGDLLPSGKPGAGDALHEPVPEMRAAVAEGDVSGALARAITGLPTSRGVILRSLKAIVDRVTDPIRTRISEERLTVNGREVPAYYDRATGEIVVDTRYADRPDIIAHEAVHAATHSYIDDGLANKLTGQRKSAYDGLYALWLEAREKSDMPLNGRENLHEFVADAMSNPEMQDFLKSYQSQYSKLPRLRNMYNSFVGAVRQMVGLPPKSFSALEDVIGLTNILQTGGERPNSRARVVESKGLQSGLLSRYINEDGEAIRQDFGLMQRLEDGTYRVETDSDSVYGRNTNDFDTYQDAADFVAEKYGAEIRELSSTDNAIREGLLSRYDAKNPVISKVAQAVEQALGRYLPPNAQEFMHRIVQTISTGAEWLVMQTDRYEILNRIDRALAAVGVDSSLHQTFENARRQQRAQGRIGSDLATLLTTIGDKLRPINRTADDLGRYMYALHGLERNARYGWKGETSGFKFTDAAGNELTGTEAMQRYLDTLPDRDKQVFREAADKVWSQWQKVLKEEERSGILSTEQYRKLGGLDENGQRAKDAYEFYVPLRNEEDLNGWLMPKQGISGRQTEAANPFAALVIQLQQRMAAVYKNDAMRELAQTLKENPIPEVSRYETYKLRWDVNGKLVGLPEHVRNYKNAAYWREGGTLKVMHINDSTTDGKYLLKALRSNNMNQNALLRGIGSITRYMAMFNTVLNPAFQLKTIAWDITTTMLNYQAAYGGDITAAQGAKLALQSVLRAGKLLPEVAAARYRYQSDSPAYNLFGKLGGGMGAGAFLNQSNIERSVLFDGLTTNRRMLEANGLLKGTAQITKGYAESALHMLHSADDAIRYAGFVEYLQHHTGRDITTMTDAELTAFVRQNQELVDQGIRGSKEINGNFERQGNGGMLHNLYAFWNAAMQGSRLFASIASSRQGQYGMMALMAMGMVSALDGISQPDDDDGAGGSKYASMRNRTNAFIAGDYALPIIYEGRLPYVLANSGTLFMSGKLSAGQFLKDVLVSGWDMFSPITPLDSGDVGFSAVYAVTPTAAQLAFPLFLGKTAFNTSTDAEFVTGPDGKRVYNPTPIETAKPGTSWLARQIAEGLDTVGLGAIAYPGRIDAGVQAVTGGAYGVINNILNPSATTITEGRNKLMAAVAKDFYAQPNDYELQAKYKELQQKYDAEYRRQAASDSGRDLLATGGTISVNRAGNIAKEVRNRANAVRVDGKNQSEWLQQLSKAKQTGDDEAAQAATVALYQLRQRQNQAYGWGIQELRKLDEKQ